MEFKTQAQESTYNRIGDFLDSFLGSDNVHRIGQRYVVREGSALIEVRALAWGDDESLVNCASTVVRGATLAPELMRFLLQKNRELPFGAFGVDEDGDIVFDYSMPGDALNKSLLRIAVKAVAAVSDNYDDEIVSQWGGKTSMQFLKE